MDNQDVTDQFSLMQASFHAAKTTGPIHYSRFAISSERTLPVLGDFEFSPLMTDLAKPAGPMFETMLSGV
jgi:hypothetical protein